MAKGKNRHEDSGAFRLLLELYTHLGGKRRFQLILAGLLILTSALSEIGSLASIIPFLAVLSNPKILWEKVYVREMANFLGINSYQDLVIPVSILFGTAAVIAALVRLSSLWINGRIAALIGSDISCKAYYLTLFQPYEVHLNRNGSEVIAATTTHTVQVAGVINSSLQLITSLFISIGLLIALMIVDWQIASIAIAVFGLSYLFIGSVVRRGLLANSRIVGRLSKLQVQTIQEGLGAIRDILLDGSQNEYFRTYRKLDLPMRLLQAKSGFIGSFPRYVLEAIGLILITFLAVSLTYYRADSLSVITLLGTLALGSQRLLPALQQVYVSWSMINARQSSLEAVLKLLNQSEPISSNSSGPKKLAFDYFVKAKEICFAYDNSNGLTLKNINLTVSKGEKIGIIGPTGSGKSTLVDILMGLLRPTNGDILVDNKSLYDLDSSGLLFEWRSKISHVPQSIFLSDATIAENIAFGVPKKEIDIDRVRRAAGTAQISSYIESQPAGYNALVGERGIKLSGGQRQRIGIARALYKDSSIIIFDEATSALDPETELSVMESLENVYQNLTIIIIAHRYNTVSRCDRIIKIKDGEIEAQGSPDDVLDDDAICQP